MPAEAPVHISSLVVLIEADRVRSVERAINALDDTEVSASDGRGRSVVVVEALDDDALLRAFTSIETLDGVLSVALVYHHSDAA